MELRELMQGVRVFRGVPTLEVGGVAYDSRQVLPGDVFVAVEGYETDGHAYISQAVERGAAAVVCGRTVDCPVPTIQVENTRKALSRMSANFYGHPAETMTVIGVTGTNGKTTTTHLIKHLLEQLADAKVGLIGTNHNLIGDQVLETERTTPESLELQKLFRQMKDAGCTHVVMEVSSHALYLDRVADIDFEVGVFTNLTQDHLDFHKTMEAYLDAKALLFRQCRTGVINIDGSWSQRLMEQAECNVFTCSVEQNSADLVAKNIRLMADHITFETLSREGISRTELGIPGAFNVYNALCAEAVALVLGYPIQRVTDAMKGASGVKGRMEVVPSDGEYTILIDYAHTPDALENVLKAAKGFASGRVVALFGCGGDRDRTKRPLMGGIAARLADLTIVTSDNPRTERPEDIIADITAGIPAGAAVKVIPDRVEAIHWAIENHQPGDVILLCGKGHETYQIVGKVKHHMDEREIVAECLQQRASHP